MPAGRFSFITYIHLLYALSTTSREQVLVSACRDRGQRLRARFCISTQRQFQPEQRAKPCGQTESTTSQWVWAEVLLQCARSVARRCVACHHVVVRDGGHGCLAKQGTEATAGGQQVGRTAARCPPRPRFPDPAFLHAHAHHSCAHLQWRIFAPRQAQCSGGNARPNAMSLFDPPCRVQGAIRPQPAFQHLGGGDVRDLRQIRRHPANTTGAVLVCRRSLPWSGSQSSWLSGAFEACAELLVRCNAREVTPAVALRCGTITPCCWSQGVAKDTRGTAFVVYEDIYDAKMAVEHLSGFNVANRYLIVLYYNPSRQTKKVRLSAVSASHSTPAAVVHFTLRGAQKQHIVHDIIGHMNHLLCRCR